MSTLNVTNIANPNGTTGLTVASTGIVTASKEIVETDYMIDQWRLTQNSTGNGVINQYWARYDYNQVGNSGNWKISFDGTSQEIHYKPVSEDEAIQKIKSIHESHHKIMTEFENLWSKMR